jgi:hypothetical protein
MSHIDRGQYKGTCQTCGKPVRTRGVGTVWRHRNAAGNECSGSNAHSRETVEDIKQYQAERAAAVVAMGGA